MGLSWIDEYVDGVIENYNSNDAIYIRSFYGIEVVYLRDNLPSKYEKFVLSYELGHAILHTEIASAAYSNKLIPKDKTEQILNITRQDKVNIINLISKY